MVCPERQTIATNSPTRRGTPKNKKEEKRITKKKAEAI
jgi:hypothetical protein